MHRDEWDVALVNLPALVAHGSVAMDDGLDVVHHRIMACPTSSPTSQAYAACA
jgi:hypothetical protein